MFWLDLVLAVVFLLSTLVGMLRGLIREVFSLGSLVLAGWIAVHFSADLAPELARWVADEALRQIVAGVGLFIASAFALGLVSALAFSLLKKMGLAGVDRTLGALFGLIRGGALAVVAVWVIEKTPYVKEPWWQGSVMRHYIEPARIWLDEIIQGALS